MLWLRAAPTRYSTVLSGYWHALASVVWQLARQQPTSNLTIIGTRVLYPHVFVYQWQCILK